MLKSVYFVGVPFLSGKAAKMYFEILDAKTMTKLYSSKGNEMKKFEYYNDDVDQNERNELLPELDVERILLAGDILIRFKNGSSMTSSTLFRISINVSFLQEFFEVGIDKIDPNSFKKDNRFPSYFKVGITTTKFCKKCTNFNELDQLCMH